MADEPTNVEAPETPAAEAPAETPVETPEESLTEVVQRHAEASQQPVETPEETPAEEAAAAEEAPEAEVEETPEAVEDEAPEYTQEQMTSDIETFNAGEDAPGYDEAFKRLDDADMIEYEEAEAEEEVEPPEEETEQERMLRELYEDKQRRDLEDQQRAEEARMKQEEEAFFAELDKHFAGEGEQFPRDTSTWTDQQRLQAGLTAQYEDATKAKEMLQKFADDAIAAHVNGKPEAEAIPNTDGPAAPAKEVTGTPRESIADVARRQFEQRNAPVG